jgi:hypothetical protein
MAPSSAELTWPESAAGAATVAELAGDAGQAATTRTANEKTSKVVDAFIANNLAPGNGRVNDAAS